MKTFTTLADTDSTFKEMGINVKVDGRENLQNELLHNALVTASTSNRAGLSMMMKVDFAIVYRQLQSQQLCCQIVAVTVCVLQVDYIHTSLSLQKLVINNFHTVTYF